jgi:hypothetical protein
MTYRTTVWLNPKQTNVFSSKDAQRKILTYQRNTTIQCVPHEYDSLELTGKAFPLV